METEVLSSVQDEFTLIKTIVYRAIAIILLSATRGKLGYNKREIGTKY